MVKNHPHFKSENVSSDDVLRISLLKFFQKKENIERFLPILTRTSSVSLRLLDYFCVTYSKCTRVNYVINDKQFDAYSSYKNQLNMYSKKKFDPFQRNVRLPLFYNGKNYRTTIAQLCFFKWCLTYNVIDYVNKHKVEINEDMKIREDSSSNSSSGSRSLKKKSCKKNPQSSAIRVRETELDHVIVSFE